MAKIELREVLIRWLGVARAFQIPNGAIIAHGPGCLFYKLVTRGLKPSRRDCTCAALTLAEDLLALIKDTKGEMDRLDNPDAAIYEAPCASCRCGSLCHWDDIRTPPPRATGVAWAARAEREEIECQRCPCKAYKIQSEV